MKTLTDWELENGYVKHKHFYRPLYCILKNGEIIDIHGAYDFPHYVAWELVESEQVLSDDIFTIDIFCYTPKPITWYDDDTQKRINDLSDNPFSEVQP